MKNTTLLLLNHCLAHNKNSFLFARMVFLENPEFTESEKPQTETLRLREGEVGKVENNAVPFEQDPYKNFLALTRGNGVEAKRLELSIGEKLDNTGYAARLTDTYQAGYNNFTEKEKNPTLTAGERLAATQQKYDLLARAYWKELENSCDQIAITDGRIKMFNEGNEIIQKFESIPVHFTPGQ